MVLMGGIKDNKYKEKYLASTAKTKYGNNYNLC